MGVSDARLLKTLETENAGLKKLLADSMLDNSVLKDLLGTEAKSPSVRGKAEGDDASTKTRGRIEGDVEARPVSTSSLRPERSEEVVLDGMRRATRRRPTEKPAARNSCTMPGLPYVSFDCEKAARIWASNVVSSRTLRLAGRPRAA